MYSINRDRNMGALISKGLQSMIRESIIKPTIVAAVTSKLAPAATQVAYAAPAAAPAAASVGSQAQPIYITVPSASTGVATGTATTGAAISPQYLPTAGASGEMEVLKKYAPYIIGGLALIMLMGKK